MKKLYRSKTDRSLGGILGGLSDYWNIDSNLLRVLFIIGVFVSGIFPFVIGYIVGYFLIPEEVIPVTENKNSEPQKENQNVTSEPKNNDSPDQITE